MSIDADNLPETTAPVATAKAGNTLAVIALVVPAVVATFLTLAPLFDIYLTFGTSLLISAATVLSSALLLAIDAHHLGKIDLQGKERDSAGVLFLGICMLWIVVYPVAYFRRRHFTGPDFRIPSVVVAMFFLAGPLLIGLLTPISLPKCDSREVIDLVQEVVRRTPDLANVQSIDGHREVEYDKTGNRRRGICTIHRAGADVATAYVVEWQDQKKALFAVRVLSEELPASTSPDVLQVLEQLVRSMPYGDDVTAIDGHRSIVTPDPTDKPLSECIVHLTDEDMAIHYTVEWLDKDWGHFGVRCFPAELPTCTRQEVTQVVNELLMETALGEDSLSINEFEEVSYDREKNERIGKCVVHGSSIDTVVKFAITWSDREKGLFQVELLP